MNPLLNQFSEKFEATPFHLIKDEHYLPAIKYAIDKAKENIEKIKNNTNKPSFKNVIIALEKSDEMAKKISTIFFNLHSAATNDIMLEIAKELSPLMTEFSNDIILDDKLFLRIKQVYDSVDFETLSVEEKALLKDTYKSFVRNGALLSENDKKLLRKFDQELAVLSLRFGDNVLKEINNYQLVVTNEDDLNGLPDYVIEAAKSLSDSKGLKKSWVFTLDYPSYIPFMKHAKNRKLRQELSYAYTSRANKKNEYNNQKIIKKISDLRHQRAVLLGYESHAHFVLQERMASNPETVLNFLNDFKEKSLAKAKLDVNDVEEIFHLENSGKIQAWDYSYYAEKLKKKMLNFDDEFLKPYFELEACLDGAFLVANKLYGLHFIKNENIPVYNKDVVCYEVLDKNNNHKALFYVDFYSRKGKRNGAWMTEFRGQHKSGGENQRPHVAIVCNFPRPTKTTPSLLSIDNLRTLFHEFGHALHGILSEVCFESNSGPNVYWDFVELPSQIMENWIYEKECLDLFAKHYKTGETIPDDVVKKIKESIKFQEGYATVRQTNLGLLDMAWHTGKVNCEDVEKFEKDISKELNLFPDRKGTSVSTAFSHIFQGGYSAGYYSYKWSEVLDADAFELFKKEGIFNKKTAQKFEKYILSKGGTEHPMELYKKFRGKEPSNEALLKRAGLL